MDTEQKRAERMKAGSASAVTTPLPVAASKEVTTPVPEWTDDDLIKLLGHLNVNKGKLQ